MTAVTTPNPRSLLLSGRTIMISGAIPFIGDPAEKGISWNAAEITETVGQVCKRIISEGGRILHGSHPTLVERIAIVVDSTFCVERSSSTLPNRLKSVILHVSLPHVDSPFLEDWSLNGSYEQWAEVVRHGEPGGPREATLTIMRKAMVEACDAVICVGGRSHNSSGNKKPGVKAEVDLALAHFPPRPVYLAAAAGGFTQELYRNLFAHGRLTGNGLSPEQNQYFGERARSWEIPDLLIEGLTNFWKSF